MLSLREEIKSESNPLWSIEIRRYNVDVCKGFYEEVIFEADLSIFVKPQQYVQIFVCSTIGIYTKGKVFPLVFGDTGPKLRVNETNKQPNTCVM
jgi:hypothetical protein